ncbi:MAG: hypothetical protein J5507_04375, partial [Clostridia bacterium]|nr:hypothetical protein [Clostridia bacterium]
VSREQIVAAMIGAYDNNGNFVKANAKLPEETKWCSKDENYSNASGEENYVVTKNNEKFYVSPTDGTVLDEEPKGIDNLIPTDAEKLLANNFEDSGNNIYLYIDNIFYVETGILKMVQIEVDSGIYMWLCNDETAVNYDVTGLNAKKWYINNEEFNFGSYSGPCPIEFTEEQLQNNSYLQRISDSF